MRSAAATVAERGADLIDLNMGCPVPKVCKTGAGAALLNDPDTAVAVARGRARGQRPAGHREAALRPAAGRDRRLRARPPPRRRGGRRGDRLPPAQRPGPPQGRAGLRARRASSSRRCRRPVILTGGLRDAARVARRLRAHRRRRRDARARLARQPVALRAAPRAARRTPPRRAEILAELDWVMDRAVEHLGAGARGPLPAQVLPLVREPSRRAEDRAAGAPADRVAGRSAGGVGGPAKPAQRRLTGAILPRSNCPPRRRASPLRAGFSSALLQRQGHHARDVILTPEGLEGSRTSWSSCRPPATRGGGAHQGGPGVRRHLRELRVRRRQERADDARAAIAQLEERLRSAQVIDPSDISTDAVQVGSVVQVKDEKTGKSQKFTIVGSAEANPAESKLSNESPVGRALIGRKRNDVVSVQVPRGPARKLKITKIDVGL